MQDIEEASSSSQEEVDEDMMMDNKTTLHANINERDVQVNILPPTDESNNQQSIEDQIANMEQEIDQAYGTRICRGMRLRKKQTLIPSKFHGFSNTITAKI
eukprot:10422235-Ditylum_brightwellii.AAC.1